MGLFSKLTTGVCVAYAAFVFRNVFRLVDLRPADAKDTFLRQGIESGTAYRVSIFLTKDNLLSYGAKIDYRISDDLSIVADNAELVVFCDAVYGYTPEGRIRTFLRTILGTGDPNKNFDHLRNCHTRKGDAFEGNHSEYTKDLTFQIPDKFVNADEIFLHAIATAVPANTHEPLRFIFPPASTRFTSYLPIEKLSVPLRYLLKDSSGVKKKNELRQLTAQVAPHLLANLPKDDDDDGVELYRRLKDAKFVAYPTEFTLGPVIHRDLPRSQVAKRGLTGSIFRTRGGDLRLIFPLSLNTLTAPRDEFLPLQALELVAAAAEDRKLLLQPANVTLKFRPVGLRAWLLQHIMSNRLDGMENKFGMGQYDIDSLKIVLGGGNPFLLTCTLVISILHILFSILALASDVDYWKREENVLSHGVSRSSLEIEALLESLILLNLWWEGQSIFVLLFPTAHLLMLFWKWRKLSRTTAKTELRELEQYERRWMFRLAVPLVLLCLAVCLWLLFKVPQAGWRGWAIKSLAMCAYGAGFASMTPQVFRNYKLQSVENLPWATLVYQALNAFVDDFFALIIRMPQMHRISVFRDDVIFLVYSAQRWMYARRGAEAGAKEKAE